MKRTYFDKMTIVNCRKYTVEEGLKRLGITYEEYLRRCEKFRDKYHINDF